MMVSRPKVVKDCEIQLVEPMKTVTNAESEPKLRPVMNMLPPAVAGAVVGLILKMKGPSYEKNCDADPETRFDVITTDLLPPIPVLSLPATLESECQSAPIIAVPPMRILIVGSTNPKLEPKMVIDASDWEAACTGSMPDKRGR
jgi:hypothetical protein